MTKLIPPYWLSTSIGKVAKVSSGSTPLRSRHIEFFQDGTIPWVKTMDLTNNLIIETEEKITELAAKRCKPYLAGTVLVAMYGGFNQIGRTGLLGMDAAVNQAISAISVDKKIITPAYLLRYLNAKVDLWKNFAASSRKDPNITRSDVCHFPVIVPPLAEQNRIVMVLETWDASIRTLEKKIELKKRVKKELAQRLLTGKQRLPGFSKKWQLLKMGDLFERITRITKNSDSIKSYSISSKIGFETQEEKYNRVMSGDSLKRYTHILKGEFAYNKGNSITYPNGCVYIFQMDEGLVPFVYICFKNKGKVNSDFYRHYFLQNLLDKELKANITSGVRGNGLLNISPESFFSCKVNCPPIEEQVAIASVLETAIKEIEVLSKKLTNLKKQKNYLMTNLITGRIRTPENMPISKS